MFGAVTYTTSTASWSITDCQSSTAAPKPKPSTGLLAAGGDVVATDHELDVELRSGNSEAIRAADRVVGLAHPAEADDTDPEPPAIRHG